MAHFLLSPVFLHTLHLTLHFWKTPILHQRKTLIHILILCANFKYIKYGLLVFGMGSRSRFEFSCSLDPVDHTDKQRPYICSCNCAHVITSTYFALVGYARCSFEKKILIGTYLEIIVRILHVLITIGWLAK